MNALSFVRTPVVSTSLGSVGFSREARILEVEFLNGSFYRFFEVPADVFEELLGAESKGSFFNRVIRGRYAYARLAIGSAA